MHELVQPFLDELRKEPEQASQKLAEWLHAHPSIRDFQHARFGKLNLAAFSFAEWGLRLEGARFIGTDLSKADFEGMTLGVVTFHNVIATSAVFERLKESNLDFRGGILNDASFNNSSDVRLYLNRVRADRAKFEHVSGILSVSGGSLNYASFRKATIKDFYLVGAQAKNLNCAEATLSRAQFGGCDLENASFTQCDLTEAHFDYGANLRGAKFDGATLTNARFGDVEVDTNTSFHHARNVTGCAINAYSIASLNQKDFGGLTPGLRQRMKIRDDLLTLRSAYSGFQLWMHALALVAFVFPYAWFLGLRWVEARFKPNEAGDLTILEAFARFIATGGEGWRGDDWKWNLQSFVPFVVASVYNLGRGVLLWKTKQLEFRQEASGVPVAFSLSGGGWGRLYQATRWGFYIGDS